MAVRFEMNASRLAQVSLLSSLCWLQGLSAGTAQAQPAVDAGSPPPKAPPAPAAGSLAPPAAPPTTQPNQGFTPAPSPLVPAPSPNAGYQPTPVYPQQAPVYPQQAPVYPQPYGTQPAQPGYYGSYPPPSGYPPQQGYPVEQERVAGPGAYMHEGFFLRFKIGIGAGGTSYEERVVEPRVSDIKTRGLAGNFELSIGGNVIENLALHGTMVLTVIGANKKVDGVDDNSYDRISSTLFILGGGATYYFMPTNLYLTLVLGAGGVVESRYIDGDDDSPDDEITSGAGLGTSLSVGKEWWVGRSGEWGLGAAITGSIVTAPVRIGELKTRFLGDSVSLNFSSTFN